MAIHLELAAARWRLRRRIDRGHVDTDAAGRVGEGESAVALGGVRIGDGDKAGGRVAGHLEDDLACSRRSAERRHSVATDGNECSAAASGGSQEVLASSSGRFSGGFQEVISASHLGCR